MKDCNNNYIERVLGDDYAFKRYLNDFRHSQINVNDFNQ